MRRCLALCLLLAACGLKEPKDERVRKTIASWDGALALSAEHWAKGELPKHFVKNAAEAATEELSKQTYGHAAARALAMAAELKEAAERDDRNAAVRLSNELAKESKELQQQ
jgi:hypothetical protein